MCIGRLRRHHWLVQNSLLLWSTTAHLIVRILLILDLELRDIPLLLGPTLSGFLACLLACACTLLCVMFIPEFSTILSLALYHGLVHFMLYYRGDRRTVTRAFSLSPSPSLSLITKKISRDLITRMHAAFLFFVLLSLLLHSFFFFCLPLPQFIINYLYIQSRKKMKKEQKNI